MCIRDRQKGVEDAVVCYKLSATTTAVSSDLTRDAKALYGDRIDIDVCAFDEVTLSRLTTELEWEKTVAEGEAIPVSYTHLLLARIILFGFATVIALIGLSNLYNSLIASLQYRKGEFAMLRAVGMSDKATNKMIRIESLFYGMKLILFGIPIAVLVSFLIHRYLNQNINIPFTVPVLHYAIASAACLLYTSYRCRIHQ